MSWPVPVKSTWNPSWKSSFILEGGKVRFRSGLQSDLGRRRDIFPLAEKSLLDDIFEVSENWDFLRFLNELEKGLKSVKKWSKKVR
jgi:hypothetical protein